MDKETINKKLDDLNRRIKDMVLESEKDYVPFREQYAVALKIMEIIGKMEGILWASELEASSEFKHFASVMKEKAVNLNRTIGSMLEKSANKK